MLTEEDARRMAQRDCQKYARARIKNAIDRLEDALEAEGQPQRDLIHDTVVSLKYVLDFLIPKGD